MATAINPTEQNAQLQQQDSQVAAWGGVEDNVDDPEEVRVIFCALDSFSITHLRRCSFYALPKAQWTMLAAPPFNFLQTLDKVDEAIDSNAELAKAILKSGLQSFYPVVSSSDDKSGMPRCWAGTAKHTDIDKATSTIRHFYRDWTADGAKERGASYGPIMKALCKEKANASGSQPYKVLVPGAGLGRLVFDLCHNGFDAEGNEISYHQLLASSFILNGCQKADQFTIYPWIHTFSNHLTRQNHLRGYSVPDVHPATMLAATPNRGTMAMSAADFLCLYGDEEHKEMYDAVATSFFLDTAPNLIRYLGVIKHALRPGGVLVNVGPLLWHFENNAPGNQGHDDGDNDPKSTSGIADPGSFELANDEVMALLEKLGFAVEWIETGIRTPYIQDEDSMLQTTYRASAWMARKPASLGIQ